MKKWALLSPLIAAFLFTPIASLAQAPKGATPRAKDGKPNLSGVWLTDAKTYENIGQVSLTPAMQKVYQQRSDNNPAKHDPVARCLPTGVPRITKEPFKIMQVANLVLMMMEGGTHSYRQFFIGEEHSDEIDAAWMGHSVAKWDGDTLVVDTTNFNDLTWLNSKGMPHSESLHVVERYTRPDLNHLNVNITMEDKDAFTKPTTFQRQHTLSTNHELREFVCNEASIDKQGLIGIK